MPHEDYGVDGPCIPVHTMGEAGASMTMCRVTRQIPNVSSAVSGAVSPKLKRERKRVVSAHDDAHHVYTRMEAEASLRQSGQRKGTRGAVTGAVTGTAPSAVTGAVTRTAPGGVGAVPGGGGMAAEQMGAVLGGTAWHGGGAVLGGGMAAAEHSAHKHRWPQGINACVRSRSWHTTHVVCALAPSWAPSAPETAPRDPASPIT
jgi:hypothetical protein